MRASAAAPGQMQAFLSPQTHLLMEVMREGYHAVATALWTTNMVRCVTSVH
jgi:hypothetical protein